MEILKNKTKQNNLSCVADISLVNILSYITMIIPRVNGIHKSNPGHCYWSSCSAANGQGSDVSVTYQPPPSSLPPSVVAVQRPFIFLPPLPRSLLRADRPNKSGKLRFCFLKREKKKCTEAVHAESRFKSVRRHAKRAERSRRGAN